MSQFLEDVNLNKVAGGALEKKDKKKYDELVNDLANLYSKLTDSEREELKKYAERLSKSKD